MEVGRYDWQPGNGTRYDLVYAPVGDRTMITWLRHGGSGGPSLLFSHFLHYSYVTEKMQVNIADAVGILKFLEYQGHDVGYPQDIPYEMCTGAPSISQITS